MDGYRNKCEFSCGKGTDNEGRSDGYGEKKLSFDCLDKIVGFRYGKWLMEWSWWMICFE